MEKCRTKSVKNDNSGKVGEKVVNFLVFHGVLHFTHGEEWNYIKV